MIRGNRIYRYVLGTLLFGLPFSIATPGFSAGENEAISGLDPKIHEDNNPSWDGIEWTQVSPGHGGTCWYLRIHPSDPNTEMESVDMGGSYITHDGAKSFKSVNDPDWAFPRLHYLAAIDFSTKSPDIGYAVSEGNGAFKTTDRGRTWQPLAETPADHLFQNAAMPTLRTVAPRAPLCAVTIDPDDPETVWVGVGRWRASMMDRFYRRFPEGMMRSTNGGQTWTRVTDAFPPHAMLRKLHITKSESPWGKLLIAGTDRGIYLSRDNGQTWLDQSRSALYHDGALNPAREADKALPHGEISDMAVYQNDRDKKLAIYVGLETCPVIEGDRIVYYGGAWRSWDLGKTWEDVTGNLRMPTKLLLNLPKGAYAAPYTGTVKRILWNAFLDENDNRKMLEDISWDVDTQDTELRSLRDAWMKNRPKEMADLWDEYERSADNLPPLHQIRVDSRDPDVFYTSVHDRWVPYGVWKTEDGGKRWICTTRGAQGWADPNWADYVPKDGPVHNIDQVWTAKHPMNWGTPTAPFGLWDIRLFDLSQSDPDILQFHSHRVTYRSEDGGKTWQDSSNHYVPGADGAFMGNGNSNMCVFDLAWHPNDPSRMLFWMADCGMKRSRDGGRSIKSLPESSFGSNQWVRGAAFDPDDPDRFWQVFGCSDWLVLGPDGESLVRGTYFLESRDFGETCEGVTLQENGNADLPEPIEKFEMHVNRLLVDPRSPKEKRRFIAAHSSLDRTAVSTSGGGIRSDDSLGVFISEDGGDTWTESNEGIDPENRCIVDLVPDPENFDVIYAPVSTRLGSKPIPGGLYVSRDSGQSWSKLDGLPLFTVSEMAIGPDRALYASGGYGTTSSGYKIDDGGGVFRSRDGGKTWEAILKATCVSNVAVSPRNPNLIYCTVDMGRPSADPNTQSSGVWRSADGGKTWRRVNHGLSSNFRFTRIRFNPHVKGEVWIGTFGTGYYRT
ncbi:hypothetical protein HQ520_05385, partial [bacterium]|nr:hypothetical protein [bacterium]